MLLVMKSSWVFNPLLLHTLQATRGHSVHLTIRIRVGSLLQSTARAMGPTISAEELIRRARVRCKPHRQPRVGGFCRECFLAELEEAIAEEHPELKRGRRV